MRDSCFEKIAKSVSRKFAKNDYEFDEFKQHLWLRFLEARPSQAKFESEQHEINYIKKFCNWEMLDLLKLPKAQKNTVNEETLAEFEIRETARQLLESTEIEVDAKELKKEIIEWSNGQPLDIKQAVTYMINQPDDLQFHLSLHEKTLSSKQRLKYNNKIIPPFTIIKLVGITKNRWLRFRSKLTSHLIQKGFDIRFCLT